MSADISLYLAFSAGLLSFFSPCVLPLIPTYLTFLLGDYARQKQKRKAHSLLPALIFIASFSLVFILLGLSATFLGRFLLQKQNIIRKLSGILVIILGLHLADIINIRFLNYQKKFSAPANVNKYLRALTLGIGMAFAWTPCIGPILSSILLYAGTADSILQGGILLSIYSLGFALPFLLAAIFVNRLLPGFKKINPYLPLINKIAGILIVIIGLLIYTNNMQLLIPQ